MPYKRKYAKKRFRRRRRKKGKHTSVKKVFRIAKKVATQVLMRNTTPNWTTTQIGVYDPNTGQWSDQFELNPGPSAGMFVAFPQIVQDAASPGKYATRIDRKVILKGIKIRLRLQAPQYVNTSYVNFYLVKAEDGTILPNMFNCPDAVTMLRSDSVNVADRNKMKIVRTKSMKINAKDRFTVSIRDIDLYYRFPKGEILEFDGNAGTDWLNKQFILVLKSSYQLGQPLNDKILVYGTITTYFRDLL